MTRKLFKRRIAWHDITIEIVYEPNWLGDRDEPLGHLQVRAIDPASTPLPITETGYRSHFVCTDLVTENGGPVAFVRDWLDAEARSPAWRKRQEAARQLSLF